jgi:hypothetical protein
MAPLAGPARPARRAGRRPVADATGLADAPSLTLGFQADQPAPTSRAMFDPATVLSLALEELAISEGDDIAESDRLHCGDTIGPCRACPVKLDTARGRDDGEA